ncbi:hypothetical protein BLA29_004027, partial [Euroglyphus maynei]
MKIDASISPGLDIYSEEDDDLPVSKRNRNLFQNLRYNVKQKFIKLQFPLGQNKANDRGESNTHSNRNMKHVMKTLMTRPLRLKIRPGDSISDGKLLVNRFGRKKRDPISKLLQELDRVMHLLFTNIGVEFIWNHLALTFNTAAEESIALRKILHFLVRSATISESKRSLTHKHIIYDEHFSEEESFDQDDESNEEGSDDDDDDDDSDTISHSLSWLRNLVPTMLLENVQSLRMANNYSFGSTTTTASSSSSSTLSSSSTTYASPRLRSPEFRKLDNNNVEGDDESGDNDNDRRNGMNKSSLKTKLLISLMNRCRQCGKMSRFSSPVQPVGTESVTILESCTLARFLLGDSHPYPHGDNGYGEKSNEHNEDSSSSPPLTRIDVSNYSTSSLFVNSISVSMNRCSALEPLEVGTANYTFLIHFLDHVLKLICQSVKSFTPIDIRASIELCLALCSKLKPAIMQTFTKRYRRELNAMKSKDFANLNDSTNTSTRKPSITSWFQSYGQQQQQQQ